MALEWIVLAGAVGLEAVLLLIVSMPLPHSLVKSVVTLYKQILQPLLAILPFALFQLLGTVLSRDCIWRMFAAVVVAFVCVG